MNNQRNQSDDNYDTRRHLGFKLQDKVTISNRFFYDHKIKPVYTGVGVVIAKIMPTPNNLPALIIKMPLHPIMVIERCFKELIMPMHQIAERHTIVLKIHPLYLELYEAIDGKKTKRKSA